MLGFCFENQPTNDLKSSKFVKADKRYAMP